MSEPVIYDQSCINCHFFCYIGNAENSEIKSILRKTIIKQRSVKGLGSSNVNYANIGCHHRVWKRDSKIVEAEELFKDRNNFCYFWEYREGMSPKGGVKLERRKRIDERHSQEMKLGRDGVNVANESAKAAIKSSRAAFWTAIAAIIAAIASLITAILTANTHS